MKKLMVCELLGKDIRTRSRASRIRMALHDESFTALDFTGVVFITRSFADELYTIVSTLGRDISIIGMQSDVKDMYEVVKQSRSERRVRHSSSSEIKYPTSMKELEDILLAF